MRDPDFGWRPYPQVLKPSWRSPAVSTAATGAQPIDDDGGCASDISLGRNPRTEQRTVCAMTAGSDPGQSVIDLPGRADYVKALLAVCE